jgi:hypothetical protein
MKNFKRTFAIVLVALMLLGTSVSASSRYYSDWFDLDRINAIDVHEDLRDDATREEVGLLIAELCDNLGLLPSRAVQDFDDERDFISAKSYKLISRLTSCKGIFVGYPDGDFKPENYITRAEAVTVILRTVNYFNLETENYSRGQAFRDVEGHWAEEYCIDAYKKGLVSGRGNGYFDPDSEITREEIITILVNLMGESNNPLISAIDKVFGLEFENPIAIEDEDEDRYYDDDRYYDNDRYYDDDEYEEATKRPVIGTGTPSSTTSRPSYTTNNQKPDRPEVDLTTTRPSVGNSTEINGLPERPVVGEPSTSRPPVDTSTNGLPDRPIF